MKQYLLIFACAAVAFGCTERHQSTLAEGDRPASVNGALTGAPKLAATTVQLLDSVHNFGTAAEGSIVECSFRFKNTGHNPLIVTNVTASCGCTVAERPEQPVLPGETGSIKAKFNTTGRAGEAHKAITVYSNAEPAFGQLLIVGTVKGK